MRNKAIGERSFGFNEFMHSPSATPLDPDHDSTGVPRWLRLRGVRVNNLKNVSVDLPAFKLTAVVGVSGAGKSSLVFETLYAESQRRYLQGFSASARQYLERFDQPDADEIGELPPAVAIRAEDQTRRSHASVAELAELAAPFRVLFAREGQVFCSGCGNLVTGADALSVTQEILTWPIGTRFTIAFPDRPENEEKISDWIARLQEHGMVRVLVDGQILRIGQDTFPSVSPDTEIFVVVDRLEVGKFETSRLQESLKLAFERGTGQVGIVRADTILTYDQRWKCTRCELSYVPPQPRLFDRHDALGSCPTCAGNGLRGKESAPCPTCEGTGFSKVALAVRWHGRNIAEWLNLPFETLRAELIDTADGRKDDPLRQRLIRHLETVCDFGLGFLPLARRADELSSGDYKRLRIADAVAGSFVQTLFLIDEPSTGIHPTEIPSLLHGLHRLRDAGNTVVIIDHTKELLVGADFIVEMGPGAGDEGGTCVFHGPSSEYFAGTQSPTIPSVEAKKRTPRHFLEVHSPNDHQETPLTLPLGVVAAITGTARSETGRRLANIANVIRPGSVTRQERFMNLRSTIRVAGSEQIGEIVWMDSTPSQRPPRGNPASFLKIYDEIRDVFAETHEAKVRGFGPGHFSFHQAGGRCEVCQGQGMLDVDMQFLADVRMTCPECLGKRFQKEILEIKVRSLSIAEVLELTVREAFRFFRAQGKIERRLKFILDVGLEYLRLGQPLETLSGGEMQRLRLGMHLATNRKAKTLFILLEPMAGLHPKDIAKLLECFHHQVEIGHSFLLHENLPQVVQNADVAVELIPRE